MSALPSLRQLSYLVKLSEKLNFTQAAEASFVTQSTLSGGIQELERQLGAQLVERDRQHVRMTPIGEEVVERARALLSMATDLVQRAAIAAEPMTGLLRLGAIPTIAPSSACAIPRALSISTGRQRPRSRISSARWTRTIRATSLSCSRCAAPATALAMRPSSRG